MKTGQPIPKEVQLYRLIQAYASLCCKPLSVLDAALVVTDEALAQSVATLELIARAIPDDAARSRILHILNPK